MTVAIEKGVRIALPASMIEFTNGGDTIWVHGPKGNTILRIKIDDKLRGGCVHAVECADSPISHADMIVHDDVKVCIGRDDMADLKRETVVAAIPSSKRSH